MRNFLIVNTYFSSTSEINQRRIETHKCGSVARERIICLHSTGAYIENTVAEFWTVADDSMNALTIYSDSQNLTYAFRNLDSPRSSLETVWYSWCWTWFNNLIGKAKIAQVD